MKDQQRRPSDGHSITFNWPSNPIEQDEQPIPANPLLAAATMVAMVAYPGKQYHCAGSQAEDFMRALVAYSLRLARKSGRFSSLPPNAKSLRASLMTARLRTGDDKLLETFRILDLMNSALFSAMESRSAATSNGHRIGLRFSADLESATLTIMSKGSIKSEKRPHSFRAKILEHRTAFRAAAGDDDIVYQNIYNRKVRPVLKILPLAMFVRNAFFDRMDDAMVRELAASEVLIRKCEWAEKIQNQLSRYRFHGMVDLHGLGIPACDCRFTRFWQQD